MRVSDCLFRRGLDRGRSDIRKDAVAAKHPTQATRATENFHRILVGWSGGEEFDRSEWRLEDGPRGRL